MPRIPVGKIGVAPCGHRGEHLTANYVQCLQGCESLTSTSAADACPDCGGRDIDLEFCHDLLYLTFNPDAERHNWRCWDCGKLRVV